MTQTIKTVLLNYAVCALVGGVLEYIAPEKIKKTLRVAVVSVMLLVVISPIAKTEITLEGNLISQEELSEKMNYDVLMHTANLTERRIREEIKEILIKENVNEYEIYITTTVDEEKNTVFLTEIKIEIGKAFENKIELVKNNVPKEYQEVLKVGVKNE
ncbi:MAG: hypothetical protein UGF89_13865 [Acutalibacteraceae bacterium]|nr:hypothetical protein [Acutalibacteraceae bacterium]